MNIGDFVSRKRFQVVQTVTLFALLGFVYWSQWIDGGATLRVALSNHRSTVYGALASVFGSLLGFVMTAVSIIASLASTRAMRFLQTTKVYPAIWRIFTRAARMLGLAALVCLVGLIACSGEFPCRRPVFEFVALAFSLNAILHIGHCLFALQKIVEAASVCPQDSERATQTSIAP